MIERKMFTFSTRIVRGFTSKHKRSISLRSVRRFTMYTSGSTDLTSDEAKIVDFRSDTTSLPTPEMREIIYSALVGDAVLNEDPSKIVLERKAASLFNKEAAVLVTSGTMANLVALLVHCDRRSSEVIAGSKSHILLYEQTGAAQFGGINIREIENKPDGTFDISELKRRIRGQDAHEPITRVICIENTHNVLGGKVLPLKWIKELKVFAKSVGLPVHMDGARVFNAAVKLNLPVSKIVEDVDSVCFCLSKGLGAPYGSVLLGPREFIASAQRTIKALGGGTRQIGFMAAAGSFALDNMISRLTEDHENIQRIANVIREANNPNVIVPPAEEIHTNILFIRLNTTRITSDDFLRRLHTISEDEERPTTIKAFSLDENTVRLVSCCNISRSDLEHALTKLRFVVNSIV